MVGRALLLVAGMLFPMLAAASQVVRLDVVVSCRKPTSLLLSATNTAAKRVEVSERALPWNYSKTLYIEAFKIDGGKSFRLTRVSPIADQFGTVSIAPQQVLKGEISLRNIFAGFDDANRSADILVFYSVKNSKALSGIKFYGRPGVVVIPKKGFLTDTCPTMVTPSI